MLLIGLILTMPSFTVQGHRGARAKYPENSLPGFLYALEVGVETLELDLQVSRDDQLIIAHDPLLNPKRCLDAQGAPVKPLPIRSLTLAELQTLDCGSLRHKRFPEQQLSSGAIMPSLDQLFEAISSSKLPNANAIRFNIELKIIPGEPSLTPEPEVFVHLLLQSLKRHKMVSRCNIQSFDQRLLLAAARQAPQLTRSLLIAENHVDHLAVAYSAQAQIISPHHLWILKPDVERLQRAGLKVIPWTANDPQVWMRLLRLGVDGMITDDPEALIAWRAAQFQ